MVRDNIPFLFSKNYWLENEVLKRRCLLRVEIFLQLSVLWYVLTTTTQSKARNSISITMSLVEVYGLGGYGSIFPLNLPLSLPVVVSGMVGSMFGHTSCFNCTANFLIPFQIVWSLSRTRLIHWFG